MHQQTLPSMTSDNRCHIKSVFSLVEPPIPNKAYKGCTPSQTPKTSLAMQPERPPHGDNAQSRQDPWLLDTDFLLRELDRCHALTNQIPISTVNATHLAIQTAAHAIWDLKERLRFCIQNRSEAHSATQRAFRAAAAKQSRKRQTKPIDRQATARPANARRKA
jgi:hypothetical protein